tara:strand:+ start:5915 stop:6538 length:624 start_codon:yes stop_codon:yes gene_type:complete
MLKKFNKMNEGDLLKIYGETGEWYGELVGINEDDQLEVFYINRSKENHFVWKYDDEWEVVSRNSVLEHIPLDKNNPVASYKLLGFKPLDENTFTKIDEENSIPADHLMPTGEINSDDELDSEDSLNDFIVPDEEGEAFTHAPMDSDFVQETHECVNQYNNWEPKNASEKKMKSFVDNLAEKYKKQDDNRQFAQGKTVDYDHPPMKKK